VLFADFTPNFGDVPSWLGAVSIVLAFVIFGLERRNRSRAQVDALGVWTRVSYTPKMPDSEDAVGEVSATVFARNAADVPVKVVQLACALRPVWMVPDPDAQTGGPPGRIWVWRPEPGLDPPVRSFLGPFTVAPGDQFENLSSFNVDHTRPEGAIQLSITDGASCDVMWVLVIDNAGRRWEIRPGTSGRARRIRRWSRRREYQPVDWGWLRTS
jgi:hypothetical protein